MSAQENSNSGRKPDFIAYNVQESKDGKGYFNKVGAAWQHRDGKGYELHLDSMPMNGRVTLRELREERMQGYENQRREPESSGPERGREPDETRSRGRSR